MPIFYLPYCDFFMAICGCIALTLLLARDVYFKSVIKIQWWKYLSFAAVFAILSNFLFSLSYIELLKQFSGIYCIEMFILFWMIQRQRASMKSSCPPVVHSTKNKGSEAENGKN
ncbi:MAG: hypothetical protein LBC20_01940 [Planctomycetaceae bacterium]|jgi:hypothetical protein|nr:hypothetical protein [Planctomycetaceae bacterium]